MKYELRHGENPHQSGYLEIDQNSQDPLALHQFKPASGETLPSQVNDMSWICLTDLSSGVEALVRIASAFEKNIGTVPQICLLVQHGNPCGAAYGPSDIVLNHAINCNYRASYGSFLITNVALTEEVVFRLRQWMPAQRPFTGVVAPVVDELGTAFFERKNRKCHVLANPALASVGMKSLSSNYYVRSIRGATLSQTTNEFVPLFPKDWDQNLIEDMCLAWGICASSDSNCITVVKDGKLVTNAVGQPSRTGAVELAVLEATQSGQTAPLKGASVVSDSFFAFADGIDMLARKKVRAIFATSGSIHDEEVRAHAETFDIIMHTVPDSEGRVFAGH